MRDRSNVVAVTSYSVELFPVSVQVYCEKYVSRLPRRWQSAIRPFVALSDTARYRSTRQKHLGTVPFQGREFACMEGALKIEHIAFERDSVFQIIGLPSSRDTRALVAVETVGLERTRQGAVIFERDCLGEEVS